LVVKAGYWYSFRGIGSQSWVLVFIPGYW